MINVLGFCLNPHMQDRHFNILMEKKKNHAIVCKVIITWGGNEEVAMYGNAPSLFLPLSPHPPLHFHSSTPFHNYSPHTPFLISRAFQFCQFKVALVKISQNVTIQFTTTSNL